MKDRLLLHSCCAPCSGGIIETLLKEEVVFSVLFFNPNIYPEEEYLKRKGELINFCQKFSVPLIDLDYDHNLFLHQVQGRELDQERGKRCEICFLFRLKKTAEYAKENEYQSFDTTLSISRWKDINQVFAAGGEAERLLASAKFLGRNWRKHNGVEFSSEVSKREGFYRQNYCGCEFSMRQ